MAACCSLSLPPLTPSRHTIRPAAAAAVTFTPNTSRVVTKESAADSIRFVVGNKTRSRGGGAVCYAAALAPQTLRWISVVSSSVLMLTKGTTIQKSFLVPLFVLQAPATVISWIKGEYGAWTTFLALLVRLFYFIPGELDLPFLTMLVVIVAPYEAMNLRGSQAGALISLAIAGYLAFQHFSRAGSLRRAFDQVSVIPTIAVICITVVSCLFCF